MHAVVLDAIEVFSVHERAIPSPGRNELLIRIRRVGICGSDVHYWKHGKCGAFEVKDPIVLGHESSGEVVEIGEGTITELKVGDRVALEPGVPCRTCNNCRRGLYNLCKDVKFFATPPVDGTLQEFVVHPADFCFKLNDNVSLDEGALVEPLSVAIHACERSGVCLGQTVLITGSGAIGLLCVVAAVGSGASNIIVTDVNTSRLQLAKRLGATHVVNARDDVVAFVKTVSPHGSDVTIDASGVEVAIVQGLKATRAGGKFVSIGRGSKDKLSIPFFEVMDKEIDVLGVFRYRNAYPKAIALLASTKLDLKEIITHKCALDSEGVTDAFETALSGKGLKVMIYLD